MTDFLKAIFHRVAIVLKSYSAELQTSVMQNSLSNQDLEQEVVNGLICWKSFNQPI